MANIDEIKELLSTQAAENLFTANEAQKNLLALMENKLALIDNASMETSRHVAEFEASILTQMRTINLKEEFPHLLL